MQVMDKPEIRAWLVQASVVCRTCLATENLKDARSIPHLQEFLCEAISSDLTVEQHLPSFLCDRCISVLEMTRTFKEMSMRVTDLFVTYVHTGGQWPVAEMLQEPISEAKWNRQRQPLDREVLSVVRKRLFADDEDSSSDEEAESEEESPSIAAMDNIIYDGEFTMTDLYEDITVMSDQDLEPDLIVENEEIMVIPCDFDSSLAYADSESDNDIVLFEKEVNPSMSEIMHELGYEIDDLKCLFGDPVQMKEIKLFDDATNGGEYLLEE